VRGRAERGALDDLADPCACDAEPQRDAHGIPVGRTGGLGVRA